MENSTSVYGDDPEDDELFAWEELMRFRSRTLESLSTDLDGCSISAQASISPDHEDIASANGAFMDSATDSGQTSDNDSRVFNPFASTGPNLRKRLIEGLLRDIYGTNRSYSEDLEETRNLVRRGSDSSQTAPGRKFSFADYTAWRAQYYKDLSTTLQRLGYQGTDRLDVTTLQQMDCKSLKSLLASYETTTLSVNLHLVQRLKQRDRRQITQSKQCLIMSAALQALSPERSDGPRLRFSIVPPAGDGYLQWIEAMRAVLQLPGGLPSAFRKTMWITIANRYISQLPFDWDKIKKMLLLDRFNPDEEALGAQIVKDLHRTGCSGFCGEHNEKERYLLQRVLLAYARFRPSVGYCQGFNIIAAVILDVVDKDEENALKIMIYLIEHVLPANYFSNDLEALAIDLSVFQGLVCQFIPVLAIHLDKLQKQSLEERGANGGSEPPLTNLFTIQWFLTLFATCLPQEATLRVWDCVFLYGSVILFRTALALLMKLEKYFLPMDTAFDFYSVMSELQQRLVDGTLFGPEEIVQDVFQVPEFDLRILRAKQLLNATNNPTLYTFHPETGSARKTDVVKRRASAAHLNRRNSATDAENDILALKKRFEQYQKDNSNASSTMRRSRFRKQSVFSTSIDYSLPEDVKTQSGLNPKFYTWTGNLEAPVEVDNEESRRNSRASFSRESLRQLNSV